MEENNKIVVEEETDERLLEVTQEKQDEAQPEEKSETKPRKKIHKKTDSNLSCYLCFSHSDWGRRKLRNDTTCQGKIFITSEQRTKR